MSIANDSIRSLFWSEEVHGISCIPHKIEGSTHRSHLESIKSQKEQSDQSVSILSLLSTLSLRICFSCWTHKYSSDAIPRPSYLSEIKNIDYCVYIVLEIVFVWFIPQIHLHNPTLQNLVIIESVYHNQIYQFGNIY